jgi:hypothetical protein
VGGTGVALIGAGAFLIARGEQSTGATRACPDLSAKQCGLTYSDAGTGWLLGGIGLGAVAAAAAWAWLLMPSDHVPAASDGPRVSALGIGPYGIAIGGQF